MDLMGMRIFVEPGLEHQDIPQNALPIPDADHVFRPFRPIGGMKIAFRL
jgi:hypothetical protein